MAWAALLTSTKSSSAPTNRAAMSSSSSRRLIATMPPVRLESYSRKAVFFTSPRLVAITRYGAAS